MKWSDKQAAFIMAPFNHFIDWSEGTPRSGKTVASIMRFALHLNSSRDPNHLIVGYNAEQAYRLVIEGDGMGLLHVFKGVCSISHNDLGAHLLIETATGLKRVYWKGGGKADSYKAIVGMSIGSVYLAEINLLHMSMIQECILRTYAAVDRWIIADCNPPAPRHPVISEVLEVQDCRFVHWTCKDNPILTEKRLNEIETACKKSPFLYKRNWLGLRTQPEGVIYFMFDPVKHLLPAIPEGYRPVELFIAGDGGTTDATSVSAYIVTQTEVAGKKTSVLFRVGCYYYNKGQKAMSAMAKEICEDFLPYIRSKYGMQERRILIDPACKALRLEIERFGLRTLGADNNAHDVKGNSKGIMCGIEMLQSGISDGHFFLVDDPRYPAESWLTEASLYCVGNNGIPVDAYNHSMDETRYAYNYFSKTYGLWGTGIRVRQKPAGL